MPGGKNNIRFEDGKPFSSTNQPTNRRKSTKLLTDLLTKELKQKKEIELEGIDTTTGQKARIKIPMPTKEVLIQALLRQAAKGNINAIREVFDRVEGKAMQNIDLTTMGDKMNTSPILQIMPVQVADAPILEDEPNLFADE